MYFLCLSERVESKKYFAFSPPPAYLNRKQIVSDTMKKIIIQKLLLAVISEAQGEGRREGGRAGGKWPGGQR